MSVTVHTTTGDSRSVPGGKRWETAENGNLRVLDGDHLLAEFPAGVWMTAEMEQAPEPPRITAGTNLVTSERAYAHGGYTFGFRRGGQL